MKCQVYTVESVLQKNTVYIDSIVPFNSYIPGGLIPEIFKLPDRRLNSLRFDITTISHLVPLNRAIRKQILASISFFHPLLVFDIHLNQRQ